MTEKIKVGIAGYGNLGRGVEYALQKCNDMCLSAIVSRRNPKEIAPLTQGVSIVSADAVQSLVGQVDVMILCGGSATDLPEQGPAYAKLFHTVDSFDTHAKIPAYFESVDAAARESGHLSIISVGWDPGLFSLNRAYASSILPKGQTYTFWGRGVSQGHSDAIRRIPGVVNAIQYTLPIEEAMQSVREGTCPTLSTREKHRRDCFVVAAENADKKLIEKTICEMPNYFADYDTTVHFIDKETLAREHSGMPHGGFVMHSGETAQRHRHLVEFSLQLDSNPEFTASVLVAYARAAARMAREGASGARSVLDIAPAMLSEKSGAQLREELL